MLCNNCCNTEDITFTNPDIEKLFESEGKSDLKPKGYVKIWENIYYSIANKNIDLTLNYIFTCNKPRFNLSNNYVLSEPPSDREKFLYLNSGSFAYLIISVFSSFSIIVGYIFFSISSPFLYLYLSYVATLCLYYFINHYVILIGTNMSYEEHSEICNSYSDFSDISVDVFLPVCGEDIEVISNTWNYVRQLEFPNYKVYVLDDGNSKEVESLSMIYNFHYIVRHDRPLLKKSGNMRNAFKITYGDYILVLDADFVPRKDMLKETIPLMQHDKNIGILQTPQYFRNYEDQSWLEKGAAGLQEVFYRILQTSRNSFNASLCVGTSAIYRREALQKFGGSAPVEQSEDVMTGLLVMNEGFKMKYLPLVLSMGVCPGEIYPFFMQQYRWSLGSFTLMLHKQYLWCGKNISFIQRVCFVNGFSYYLFHAISLFFSPACIVSILYFFPEQLLWFNIMFFAPSLFNDIIFHKLWTSQNVKLKVTTFDKTIKIQRIAFFYSLKDAIFKYEMSWVPTGKKTNSKNLSSVRLITGLKYMFFSDLVVMNAIIIGTALRIKEGYAYYNFIYIVLQSIYQFLLSFYIILYFLRI
jgi:cellulose synthase/poly-beta-1,6-N-acetylglucosamine synthase-like glycosyltransferase